jgi:hypothetical protein
MNIRLFLIFLLIPFVVCSQNGNNSFSFVNLDFSARSLAMGSNLISIYDNDIFMAQSVPSILNNRMDKHLGFSFVDYFSDINMVSFLYSRSLEKNGCFTVSLNSCSYGDFISTDETGNQDLTFNASDQIYAFGYGRPLNDKISLGVNIRLLNSNYESYQALAILSNLSSTYFNRKKSLTTTLLLKNIGKQIKSYTSIEEVVPFEVQFGLSKKLDHLPLRYSIVLRHLNKFDISNDYSLNSFTNNETGEIEYRKESIAKTMLRHVILSGELDLFKNNFFIQGGFNFQKRFDMTIDSFAGMVGFSFGVGMNVSKIRFNYSRSAFHLSGKVNTFNITTNLSTFGL